MTAHNAAKPATADAVNGPRDDRLGGAIEETNSSPFDGEQADLAAQIDRALALPGALSDDDRALLSKIRGRGYVNKFEQTRLDAALVAVAVYRAAPRMPEGTVFPAPEARQRPPETVGDRETVSRRRRPIPNPPAPPPNRGHGKWEEDDAYPSVIADISADCRVIECRDAYQWIVQRRKAGRWLNVSYHLDRDDLIARSGAIGEALAILRRLPARHGYIEPDVSLPPAEVVGEALRTYAPPPPIVERRRCPTPGALQGDDYQLEYDEDGYPKLPACLDRRTKKMGAE